MAAWLVSLTKDPVALLLLINVAADRARHRRRGHLGADHPDADLRADPGRSSDIDPVHFGIVLVTNLTIAGVTPPVGQMMFISSQVLRVPMEDYTIEVLPFLARDVRGAAASHAVPADHALAAEPRLRDGGGLTAPGGAGDPAALGMPLQPASGDERLGARGDDVDRRRAAAAPGRTGSPPRPARCGTRRTVRRAGRSRWRRRRPASGPNWAPSRGAWSGDADDVCQSCELPIRMRGRISRSEGEDGGATARGSDEATFVPAGSPVNPTRSRWQLRLLNALPRQDVDRACFRPPPAPGGVPPAPAPASAPRRCGSPHRRRCPRASPRRRPSRRRRRPPARGRSPSRPRR